MNRARWAQRSFYESGELASEVTYAKGVREGLSRSYFESGAVKREAELSRWWLDGSYITYYESGEEMSYEYFMDGEKIDLDQDTDVALQGTSNETETTT
jgi:antitoxin component YwqK of YwqJK toxin-antitoxin module